MHLVKAILAWLCLAIACYSLGAALSGFAAMFGITDFSNDHRGEWSLLTLPVSVIISFVFGYFSVRSLLRQHYAVLAVVTLSSGLTVISAAFVTWVFATAA